ncbi:MAG: alpha/beta hydrolase [Dechloromonas sp.]|nr:MAG: alpha/beta hydrolase [Dechloromonas sp.]
MIGSSLFTPFFIGTERPPLWLAGLALMILLSSCSSLRRSPSADDPFLRRYAERAYQPELRHAAEMVHENWVSGDPAAPGDIPVRLAVPRTAGRHPLVVYLPGLGEPAEAGDAWRNAWVEAGYAVLSLQAERFGPAALQGRHAKNADFPALGRESHAPAALTERLGAVRSVLSELEKRVVRGVQPFDRIDPASMAVAGYDIGAQTAQLLAGEQANGVDPAPLKHPPQAAILLSPYANAAGGGFSRRFGSIGMPVLAVTATEDGDAFGVVTSLAARLAPFNHMPDGEKYLLLLFGASHRLLAGSSRSAPEDAGAGAGRGGAGEPSAGGRPRGPGGGAGGGMPPAGRRGPPGGSGGMAGSPDAGAARQAIAIQRLSVAFLDAQLKKDPVAVEWLTRDAARWLAPVGELRRK